VNSLPGACQVAILMNNERTEVGSMKYKKQTLGLLTSILLLGTVSSNALGFLGFGDSASWKEEVLLHDGQKIVVERSQSYGGRHEIGQLPPVKEHSITFTLPGSSQIIIWKDEFSKDIGHSNFYLLVLDVVNGTPYIVTETVGCLAYNKWGRPNPPYIFFKYADQQWKQIPLQEFPEEIKQTNVIVNLDEKAITTEQQKAGLVSANKIKELNSIINQDDLKNIIREPIKKVGREGCPELVYYKGVWVSPGDSIGRKMRDKKTK
jgi:hypothetical protein